MQFRFNTIRSRILVGLGFLVLGLAVTAFIGARSLRTIRAEVVRELDELKEVSEASNGLVTTVFDELRAAEQYVIDPSPESRVDFQRGADLAWDYHRRLRSIRTLTTEDRVGVNVIGELQAQLQVDYAVAHALVDLGLPVGDQATNARGRAAELTRRVREFATGQSDKARIVANRLGDLAGQREALLWLVLAVTVILGAGVATFTLQSVESPLARLVTAAERFGGGDLRPVSIGGMPREFQVLSDAMSSMGDRLHRIVGEVIGVAERIGGSASDLSAVSEELAASSGEVTTAMVEISQGADRQRADIVRTEQGVEQIRRATEELTETADQVARLGEDIRTVATRHRGDIGAAETALLDVHEVVKTSSAQVNQLAQMVTSIEDFVDLIRRISSQTNLLALNAAIEAARAGEHGRGFGVVAEEVRQLADESARAAEEVASTTSVIRTQVEEAVATMMAGQAKVRGIEKVAEGAGRGLGEIVTTVQQVEEAAQRLAKSAGQNRQIVLEIRQKAEQISQQSSSHAASAEQVTAASEQQGASTEEMAASAGELVQAAEKLRALVSGFRV